MDSTHCGISLYTEEGQNFLSGWKVITLVAVLALLSNACGIAPAPSSLSPLEPVVATTALPASPDWITVYFTDPKAPGARSYRGGSDEELAAAIQNARQSVDIAIYDLNLWSIRDALLAAHRRGLRVRLVTESDNLDEMEIQDLKGAGIPVLGDRREGLMHDKFVVIDRQEVWSGSMNFTTSDTYLNNNNLVRIHSPQLAEDYIAEFEQMYLDDRFGPDKLSKIPYPSLNIEGTPLEVYFAPQDDTASHLVKLIQGAKHSIYFLAYSFTSDDLAQALVERAAQGVTVEGVMEETQVETNAGGEYQRLLSSGLNVGLDGNPRNMHHKVLIIDGQIVVTGSYNFSASAENKNDENTLVITNNQIGALYMKEYDRIAQEAQNR